MSIFQELLYHIGDYYYLLVAEGGTSYNHMGTAARSKNIYGPYENCPYNPILTNKNDTTKQVQCAGHADLVEDENGNWWMVHHRKDKKLLLHPSAFDFEAPSRPCFAAICQPDSNCQFATSFTLDPKEGEEGGMLLYLSSNFYESTKSESIMEVTDFEVNLLDGE